MARLNAVLDLHSSAVLTLSPGVSASFFVHQCTPDSMWELGVNSPHYRSSLIHDEPFFLARSDPEYYPEWEWNKKEKGACHPHKNPRRCNARASSALTPCDGQMPCDRRDHQHDQYAAAADAHGYDPPGVCLPDKTDAGTGVQRRKLRSEDGDGDPVRGPVCRSRQHIVQRGGG